MWVQTLAPLIITDISKESHGTPAGPGFLIYRMGVHRDSVSRAVASTKWENVQEAFSTCLA